MWQRIRFFNVSAQSVWSLRWATRLSKYTPWGASLFRCNHFLQRQENVKILRHYMCNGSFSNSILTSQRLHSTNANPGSTNVNAEEVEKFSSIAEHWWDESGEFGALHTLNTLRVPLIRDALVRQPSSAKPLVGLKLLDVGCGGGILCEPLARLGAHVTGLDAAQANISVATLHTANDPALGGRIRYICCAIEDLKTYDTTQYDAVILSEILEHIDDQRSFISASCLHVKAGGSLIVTTLNRTTLSYLLAIVAAERIFRIVPANAHDWSKFVVPDELQQMLSQNSFTTRLVHGMTLNPLTMKWSWIKDTSCNFALVAVKSNDSDKTTGL